MPRSEGRARAVTDFQQPPPPTFFPLSLSVERSCKATAARSVARHACQHDGAPRRSHLVLHLPAGQQSNLHRRLRRGGHAGSGGRQPPARGAWRACRAADSPVESVAVPAPKLAPPGPHLTPGVPSRCLGKSVLGDTRISPLTPYVVVSLPTSIHSTSPRSVWVPGEGAQLRAPRGGQVLQAGGPRQNRNGAGARHRTWQTAPISLSPHQLCNACICNIIERYGWQDETLLWQFAGRASPVMPRCAGGAHNGHGRSSVPCMWGSICPPTAHDCTPMAHHVRIRHTQYHTDASLMS